MLSGILRVFTWPLCAEDLDPRVTSARINSLKYAVILVLEGLNIVPFGSVPLIHPPASIPCRGLPPALRYSRLERRLNFLFFILVVS